MHAAHASIVSAIQANYHALANARANRNKAAVVAGRTIQSTCRFKEAAVANDNDDGAAGDAATVGSVSSWSIGVVLTNLSAQMWDTPSLCPTQEAAIAEIMHGRCGGGGLLVHRTGRGKSHILRILGPLSSWSPHNDTKSCMNNRLSSSNTNETSRAAW